MDFDPESDEEVEDEEEEEGTEEEVDPRREEYDEPAEALPAGAPFQPESWRQETIYDHPRVATRSSDEPQYAPFIDDPRRYESGAMNIPLNVKTEAQYFELFYDAELLTRYVEQTNLKVSKQASQAWDADHQLSVEELKHYFALDLYMDVSSKSRPCKDLLE
jgi:hypothetical protein